MVRLALAAVAGGALVGATGVVWVRARLPHPPRHIPPSEWERHGAM